MFDFILKKLSILKKFLLINLIAFILIGSGTVIYLKTVQPNLIKKKSVNHIKIINNTKDTDIIQKIENNYFTYIDYIYIHRNLNYHI